jgi:integrase
MLTDTKIRNTKPKDKSFKLTDSHGLYVEIKPSGLKIWRYRFRMDSKESSYTIGEYPAVSLAEARILHQSARQLVRDGISPVAERISVREKITEKKLTFEQMADEWIVKRLSDKTQGYRTQVTATLNNDVLHVIGHKAIDEVTSADVILIINATIERVRKKNTQATGEAAAKLSRQVVSSVFQYAIATIRAKNDPTYATRRVIQKPQTTHARALSDQEIRYLFGVLQEYPSRSVRDAIHFMLLTMVRTKEARLARWEDIDFDNELWTIPAELMKKRRIHLVPLSKQAITLLRARQVYGKNDVLIFPSPQKHTCEIATTTINRALLVMGCKDVTGHDFRATASTILNSNGFNGDWIERQLAHVDGDAVRRSYNHADYLKERRAMMQWWAGYLDGLKL